MNFDDLKVGMVISKNDFCIEILWFGNEELHTRAYSTKDFRLYNFVDFIKIITFEQIPNYMKCGK